MFSIKTNIISFVEKITQILGSILKKHPFLFTLISLVVYLAIFQRNFITSGDNWAEAFYEYVYGAVIGGWKGFFHAGIAGYFNFLPKIITFPYVIFGLPMQYIDYFFRITTVLFAICCSAFIAHGFNRDLIRNDWIRWGLSIITLAGFYHISSFSMINVWYIGFIPIILISLSPRTFKNDWSRIGYVSFAIAVCLTKPSIILAPFAIYRAIRHKEYLIGFIIFLAISVQTALFFTSDYYSQWSNFHAAHLGILERGISTLLYPGLLLLKLLQIVPANLLAVIISSLIVYGAFFFAIRRQGFIQSSLIFLGLMLASYTALYPPDAGQASVVMSFQALFHDEMKLQREVLIYFFVCLTLCIAMMQITTDITLRRRRLVITGVFISLSFLSLIAAYRPIDTTSGKLAVNIDPFRASLERNGPMCMPIPPTASWVPYDFTGGPVHSWFYESRGLGTCETYNYDKDINYASFSTTAHNTEISLPSKPHKTLKALLIPLSNTSPSQEAIITVKEKISQKTYVSRIVPKKSDTLNFVAFNIVNEPLQEKYEYVITIKSNDIDGIKIGSFSDGSRAYFAYYMDSSFGY